MFKSWMNMVKLAGEAQQVIWLRSLKLARGGPKAKREAKLMVEEKIATAQAEALKLMLGGSPDAMIKNYSRKVKANKLRLTK